MPDLRVERGSTARLDRVEGELEVGRGARITAADGKSVTVTGGARFEGDAEIGCDFQCDTLAVERGALKVTGDLTVLKGMDVAHTVKANGTVRAGEIEVGGKMFAGSVSCGGTVRVGGVVDVAKTFEAYTIDVGGKVRIGGAVKLRDLSVGGLAEVGGGTISGKAKVGGVFESTAPLEFGDLQVYGKCSLPAGSKGKRVASSGKLSVGGDLDCEEVQVGGVADVRGDCRSKTVRVNGKLDVSGSLSASGSLDNFGSCEVRGDFAGGELHVGGRFKASKAIVENQAEIAGEVETSRGMKAKSIVVGSGSKVRGPLVGGRVELSKSRLVMADWGANWMGQAISMRMVGRMTYAEDIYGDEVVLGPSTRCRNIFAKTVELETGSIVEQVTYTDELRLGHHKVHLTRPSEKVERLPPFPL
jgi:cytoskeletal protein CcmA (bactofilin family)